jgi:hypothetical protein
MKFLRNPIVTGILAVVAVLVVVYQFSGTSFNFHLGGTAARVVQTIAPALAPAPPPPAPATNKVTEASAAGPDLDVDHGYLEGRFAKWVAAPQRDPFLLFVTDREKTKEEAEFASPVAKWKLQGIWDQTGGKLAVINKRVHRVGDEIEGYTILRIEGDEVWFQGPKRKERLALEHRGPVVVQNPVFLPATNALPPSAVPQ